MAGSEGSGEELEGEGEGEEESLSDGWWERDDLLLLRSWLNSSWAVDMVEGGGQLLYEEVDNKNSKIN